jgi:hypothetical protein
MSELRNSITVFAMISFLFSAAITVRAAEAPDVTPGVFTNPERVTINNYNQDAMEPFISLDGNYLFFNNSNNPPPGSSTKLYYATRIDDLNFQFVGEIAGVNAAGLNAVASMDANRKFYFISTRSYMQTFSTVYWADFTAGSVANVELVPGVSKRKPGWVNFDAGISPDGNTLYFVDGFFGTANFPQSAELTIAKRKGNRFVRLADSRHIMRKINTGGLNYAPCPTASGLEFFWTRVDPANVSSIGIFTATRSNTSKPYGTPVKVDAATGFVEAPTVTADGKSLYYHKNENGTFVIYRLTRP